MHWNPHLRFCFQGAWLKASYPCYYFFTNLTFNSTSWVLESPVGCVYVCTCFPWAVLPRTKILATLLLSYVGCLCYHSAPTLSPKRHLSFSLVTERKSSVSRKRKILQFILYNGSVGLGNSSGERCLRSEYGAQGTEGWFTCYLLWHLPVYPASFWDGAFLKSESSTWKALEETCSFKIECFLFIDFLPLLALWRRTGWKEKIMGTQLTGTSSGATWVVMSHGKGHEF